MQEKAIIEEIVDQFDRTWKMMRETITGFTDSSWVNTGVDYLVPARIAYHTLETIEYYIGDKSSKEFPWRAKFAGDWETMDKDRLPTQDQVLRYMEDIGSGLVKWLDASDFSEKNDTFGGTGKTRLGHVLYILRHTLHHHGEMNYILFQSGHKKVNWH